MQPRTNRYPISGCHGSHSATDPLHSTRRNSQNHLQLGQIRHGQRAINSTGVDHQMQWRSETVRLIHTDKLPRSRDFLPRCLTDGLREWMARGVICD